MPKYNHLRREANPLGSHNVRAFRPFRSDLSVRCPQCNSLMESGFLEEGRCPVCNYSWQRRKAVARDMYVEALAVKVNHGGWSHPVLEELAGKPSQVISPGMDKKRAVGPVARQVAGTFTAIQRAKEESLRRARRRVA